MFLVILTVIAIAAILGLGFAYQRKGEESFFNKVPKAAYWSIQCLLVVIAGLCMLGTSTINPNGDQIALLDRIYLCSPIPEGRNIALDGECGKQAKVMMPGFRFIPFIKVLNNIEYVDMVQIPQGTYLNLTAKDGRELEAGSVAAEPWSLGNETFKLPDGSEVVGNLLDATVFLKSGLGQKGPQTTILPPGKYIVNPYLWDTKAFTPDDMSVVHIGVGEVGVINSAIDEDTIPTFFTARSGDQAYCGKNAEVVKDLGQIKATLVSPGCRGVWREPLKPGQYLINRALYKVTIMDTRLRNWTYAGGYKRRLIDLKIQDDGTIVQVDSYDDIDVPEDAAGDAVNVTVEGWQVYQEVRLQARVTPELAPLVVAAVGNMEEVEDRIISPQVRSVLRNIGGSRIRVKNTVAYEDAKSELDAMKARVELLTSANIDPSMDDGLNKEQRTAEINSLQRKITSFVLPDPEKEVERTTRAIDFQSERETLETMVASEIQKLGAETGIEIVQVAFGKTDLPPELLVARKVEQLASQQKQALIQQRTAQVQRQATESAKARADKQSELVQAAIDVDVSRQKIEKRRNEGQAEKEFSQLQAEGRQAEVNVLGQDRVFMTTLFQNFMETLKEKPEILTQMKLPSTVVVGGGAGLEGMAAVLKGSVPSTVTGQQP